MAHLLSSGQDLHYEMLMSRLWFLLICHPSPICGNLHSRTSRSIDVLCLGSYRRYSVRFYVHTGCCVFWNYICGYFKIHHDHMRSLWIQPTTKAHWRIWSKNRALNLQADLTLYLAQRNYCLPQAIKLQLRNPFSTKMRFVFFSYHNVMVPPPYYEQSQMFKRSHQFYGHKLQIRRSTSKRSAGWSEPVQFLSREGTVKSLSVTITFLRLYGACYSARRHKSTPRGCDLWLIITSGQ